MENTVTIHVEHEDGNIVSLEAPTDMGLNLMEFLKASEYDIQATCGGMALCATCSVDIIEGLEDLEEQSDDELDMIDTLPFPNPETRLACQIPISPAINNIKLRLHKMD